MSEEAKSSRGSERGRERSRETERKRSRSENKFRERSRERERRPEAKFRAEAKAEAEAEGTEAAGSWTVSLLNQEINKLDNNLIIMNSQIVRDIEAKNDIDDEVFNKIMMYKKIIVEYKNLINKYSNYILERDTLFKNNNIIYLMNPNGVGIDWEYINTNTNMYNGLVRIRKFISEKIIYLDNKINVMKDLIEKKKKDIKNHI